MKKILVMAFAVLFYAQSEASDSGDVLAAYVQTLFADEDFRERWNPVLWESHSSLRNDPNGGYLFHFTLDFGTSSKVYHFTSSDRFGDPRGQAPAWNIYTKSEDDSWHEIATGIEISAREIYVDDSSKTTVQHYPDGSFRTLQFGQPGNVQEKYFSVADTSDATREKLRSLGRVFEPQIEKMPLAAYLRTPAVKWRTLDRQHGIEAQSLDLGDESLLKLGNGLTWVKAKSLAYSLRETVVATADSLSILTSAPTPLERSINHRTPSQSTPTVVTENHAVPFWSWIIALVVLAVIVFVIFRRRH